ncbi:MULTISPECIES: ABC transporter ATP-binding protein [Actinoalloteichus]|uniref:ABC transport system ATP-binding protein n=1 Tax=Actinoalloteichus caeruleus DSM 43889 TaxID=1120930 RepID=A0ABT1JLA6_ACTCY|nr:ABC transporter ATP-binding protein [Actinoalloteichus caeruleus]MCP2333292.1 putative ABC transport system ATP-binding protein [Actinoalloteichus caeruleus DSM 43889]
MTAGVRGAADGGSGPLLTAVGLELTFGRNPALRGANFTIEPGEMVAVLGPSGSGKSTLLHCLAGILVPTAGSVVFDGQEVSAMNDVRRSELRRTSFGFVFQFGQLIPELTALENVAMPLRLSGKRRRVAERQALEWLDRLGVGSVADQRPGEISGGQGQRTAIARALVAGPRVVFADEPTGALDSVQGDEVMTLLASVARETDAAVVLVTHEPRVAAYSDREVIVRDGRTDDQRANGERNL